MKIENFSTATQEGLRRWVAAVDGDELMLDGISNLPEQWAWVYFRLQVAEDRPEWFPKGKAATIQFIEEMLLREAAGVFSRIPPRGGSV